MTSLKVLLFGVKQNMKSRKLFYHLFMFFKNKRAALINGWVLFGLNFIEKYQLNNFLFSNGKAYIQLENGTIFLYQPEHFGGLLGAENKVGFETDEFKYIQAQMTNQSCFFDIGANYGIYSIQLAKMFSEVQVHAFEPVLNTYAVLCENKKANGLEKHNIKINHLALGAEKGTARITINRYAGNHLVANEGLQQTSGTTLVDIDTLDNYVMQNKIPKVDFIKCDVEGAEFLVLRGSRNVLKEHRPELFLEITEEWSQKFKYQPADIFRYLNELDYVGYQFINSNSIKKFDSTQTWNPKVYNYVFKPREKLTLENTK